VPYFTVQTNLNITPTRQRDFLARATELLETQLGKSRQHIMVNLQPGQAMVFGGSSEPAAFASLKSIGLQEEQCPVLAEALSRLIQESLEISPERIFLELLDIERSRFAWNSKTFG